MLGLSCCKERSVDKLPQEKRQSQRERTRPRLHTAAEGADFHHIINVMSGGPSNEEWSTYVKQIKSLSDKSLLKLLKETSESRTDPSYAPTFASAVTELARRDPEAALSWFLPEEMESNEPGWTGVATILGQSAPQLLENWLLDDLKSGSLDVRRNCLAMGVAAIAKNYPSEALEFANKIPAGIIAQGDIINSIFGYFGNKSPAEAESAAQANYTGAMLDKALYNISLGALAPEESLSIAKKIGSEELRGLAMSGAYGAWMGSDFPAAVKALESLDGVQIQSILQCEPEAQSSLINYISGKDPQAALDILGKLIASKSNLGIFQAVVDSLAEKSPEKAVELITSIPESEFKNHLVASQYSKLASLNTPRAISQASNLPAGDSRSAAFASIGSVAGFKGLDAAEELGRGLKADDQKSFWGEALPTLAYQNPKELVDYLKNNQVPMDGADKKSVLAALGENLSSTESSYAVTWMNSLSPVDQPAAMSGISRQMAKADILQLSQLLSNSPQDEKWLVGAKVLVENVRNSDPEMAKKWQNSIDRVQNGK